MPPAALSRSSGGLTAHWHPWKASGHGKRHGFWARTGSILERHGKHASATGSRCGCRPAAWTVTQNRAGTSYRLPLGQSWVAVWRPLPLKLRIRSYHLLYQTLCVSRIATTSQNPAAREQEHQDHISSEKIPVPQHGRGMQASRETGPARLRILSDVCRHVQCSHHILSDREIQSEHTRICPQKGGATLHEFLIGAIVCTYMRVFTPA